MSTRSYEGLLGDVPIEGSQRVDALKFEHFATVLARAAVQTVEPITIGVFGEWGTGKTSLMQLIKKEVDKEKRAVPIWFNAWQYEKEEHLVVPLIATIRKELEEKEKSWEEPFRESAGKLMSALRSVAYGFAVKTKVGIPLISEAEVNLSGKDMISRYQELTKDSILDRSLYFDAFEELARSASSGENTPRIIVFVDDLDRCFPPKAVELLEGIKLVLTQPCFTFVLGVYEKIIREFVSKKFSKEYEISSDYFANYLDKIVQVKVRVPERPPSDMKDFIRGLMERSDDLKGSTRDEILTLVAESSKRNPRAIIRTLNRIMVTMKIHSLEKPDEEQYDPTALILDIAMPTDDPAWKKFRERLVEPVLKAEQDEATSFGQLLAEYLGQTEERNGEQSSAMIGRLKEIQLKSKKDVLSELIQLLDRHRHILEVLRSDAGMKWLTNADFRERHQSVGEVTAGESNIQESKGWRHKTQGLLDMVLLKAEETFMMGEEGIHDAQPHPVTLSPFLIQATPVTQKQYSAVMKTNPSEFKGDDNPVENVSWYDAVTYCNRLSEKEGLTPVYDKDEQKGWEADLDKNGYRLPTEAQWEYACRGGSEGAYCFGDDRSMLGEYAWFGEKSEGKTHPVGKKKPNSYGLYDMHGNVWEWCHDWYGEYGEDNRDPSGPASGSNRVVRGGGWADGASYLRSANRDFYAPDLALNYVGFRVALPAQKSSGISGAGAQRKPGV